MSFATTMSAQAPRVTLRVAAAVAAVVTILDLGSKIAAAALLQGGELSYPGGVFLTVVYNDTFARGLALGSLTLPATLAVAILVLALMAWIGTALARIDPDAPLALGLIAGATIANATDSLRTGQGVVDFLGFETAGGTAVVFNLADVAAYLGVALLARTSLLLCRAIAAERRAARATKALRIAPSRSLGRVLDRPVSLPLVVDGFGPIVRHADAAGAHANADAAPLHVPADSAARTARGISSPRTAVEHRVEREY